MNGKEVSREEAMKINPENISRMNVIKNAETLKKYGNKGKNGVVEIVTR